MSVRTVSLVQGNQSSEIPEDSIQNFSDEVMIDILKHLPPPALFQASLVCRKWSQLTQDPTTLVPFVRAAEDVKWLRNLPKITDLFQHYLKPRFNAVPSRGDPFVERSALLRELLKDETFQTDGSFSLGRNIRFGRMDFSTAAFNLAARQGNIRMGRLLLPVDYYLSFSPFALCAEQGQPDFARWLVTLDPAASGLPPFDITRLTTVKIHAQLGSGDLLFLNGERLFERLDLRDPPTFEDGNEEWEVFLPLKRKEETSASGEKKQYWETVLMGMPGDPNPESLIPVLPMVNTADGRWIDSEEFFYMKIGEALEITAEFKQ